MSLVEVIISVAIVSIVLVTITSFMVTGTKLFGNSSNEIELQENAQLVLNNIENRIVDAQLGANFEDATASGSGDYRVLTILNEAGQEYIFWVASENKIYYTTNSTTTAKTGAEVYADRTASTTEVLAENITDFSVKLKKTQVGTSEVGSPKADVKLAIEKSDRNIESSKTIAFRNDIATNKSADEIYRGTGTEIVRVDKVTVTPNDLTLVAPTKEGATVTYKYNARVSGIGHPSQVVSWVLNNGNPVTGVTLDNATGLITIDHTAGSGAVQLCAKAMTGAKDDAGNDVYITSDPVTLNISKITGLTVTAEQSKYYAGTFVKLNTEVSGVVDESNKKVKYEVVGENNGEIEIYGENGGLIYLAPSAQGKHYEIKVTSIYDEEKTAIFSFDVEDVSLTETGSGLAEAVRGETIELTTALVGNNLAASELNIKWSITDAAGLGGKLQLNENTGELFVPKDVNYEKEYNIEVKATVTAERLQNQVEKLIKVHIPVVSLAFTGGDGGGTISKNSTKTFGLEATGMVLAPEDVYVTTNPSLSNCIVYATKDGVQLSIGDGNKATSFDLVATLKNTNTSTTMKITIK